VAERERGERARRGPTGRMARVDEVLREVVAERLERLADGDERLRLLTVTGVRCAADLRRAVVYFDELTGDAIEALGEARPRLQAAIAREVRLRRTPRLEFVADPAVAEGEKIEAILRRVRAGGNAGEPAPSTGPGDAPAGSAEAAPPW